MRYVKCDSCLLSFTEADREWDLARESSNCPSCGSPLEQFSDDYQPSNHNVCSACGSNLEPNDKFCSQCGSAIAHTVTISDGKERNQVTDSSPRSTSVLNFSIIIALLAIYAVHLACILWFSPSPLENVFHAWIENLTFGLSHSFFSLFLSFIGAAGLTIFTRNFKKALLISLVTVGFFVTAMSFYGSYIAHIGR